jgi:hypothetical protein
VGLATRVIFEASRDLDLRGEIFTPLSWNSVSEDEVQQYLDENKLVVPANGRIHIKIINIS